MGGLRAQDSNDVWLTLVAFFETIPTFLRRHFMHLLSFAVLPLREQIVTVCCCERVILSYDNLL